MECANENDSSGRSFLRLITLKTFIKFSPSRTICRFKKKKKVNSLAEAVVAAQEPINISHWMLVETKTEQKDCSMPNLNWSSNKDGSKCIIYVNQMGL